MLTEVTDMQNTLQCNELVKNQPAYPSQMFLGQTKFPSSAQRNSVTYLIPFSPGTMGMAEQKALLCLKIFYTSITSNTFYLVYLECSKGNMFLTMAKLHKV